MLTIGHLSVKLLSLILKLHLRQPRAWLCQIIASHLTLLQMLVGMGWVLSFFKKANISLMKVGK